MTRLLSLRLNSHICLLVWKGEPAVVEHHEIYSSYDMCIACRLCGGCVSDTVKGREMLAAHSFAPHVVGR